MKRGMDLCPAVVVMAHRRPHSIRRLLTSLEHVLTDAPIPMVISIDGGAAAEVVRIAHQWRHPMWETEVICHSRHLGLTQHTFHCLAMTQTYGAVILLEDDHYAAPGFYQAAVNLINALGNHPQVAGISLYRYPRNEVANLPFEPIDDGSDVFYHQRTSTRGIALTFAQWQRFKEAQSSLPTDHPDLPEKIRRWPATDWERQFNLFTAVAGLYFAYPRHSYITNFGDTGTHVPYHEYHAFQVALTPILRLPQHILTPDQSRARYDHYSEIEPACLQSWNPTFAAFTPLTIDLYGEKPIPPDGWMLSLRPAHAPVRQFELALHPHELNVIDELSGTDISLAPVTHFSKSGLSWKRRWLRHQYHYPVPSLAELAHYRAIEWWHRIVNLINVGFS